MEREAAAESELEQQICLQWLSFLPQALLRTPRRGGRSGRGAVNARFTALANREWGKLVRLWERDVARAREREARRSSGGQIRQ